MKKIFTIITILFIYNNVISQELLSNNLGSESLIGKINSQIEKKKITENVKFYLNDKEIEFGELTALNEMNNEDIIDIQFYDKSAAIKKYGNNAIGGAVNIIPFVDETLSSKYYSAIKNKQVLETIETLSKNGSIDENPIIVLHGKPLRGEDIAIKINELKEDDIKSIVLLDKIKGYKIFGIRAIPGVLVITTK